VSLQSCSHAILVTMTCKVTSLAMWKVASHEAMYADGKEYESLEQLIITHHCHLVSCLTAAQTMISNHVCHSLREKPTPSISMPKTPIDQSIAADDSMLARVMYTKLCSRIRRGAENADKSRMSLSSAIFALKSASPGRIMEAICIFALWEPVAFLRHRNASTDSSPLKTRSFSMNPSHKSYDLPYDLLLECPLYAVWKVEDKRCTTATF
jgi:hypothetical protein